MKMLCLLAVCCTAVSGQAAAQQPHDSVLIASARQQPDSLRQSIMRTLALAAHARVDRTSAAHVANAQRLAALYARAWSDPFFVRQVAYFAQWSRVRRLAKADADSFRVAGNLAFGRDGVPAALRLWRRSLQRATAAGDSAGRAAALGSIGAGFYRSGAPDSASFYLTRARDLASSIGDLRTLGNAVGNLASVSKDLGQLGQAAELYGRASALRARTGDTRGVAADQNNLGEMARALGDLEGARRAYERALELNRRGNRPQFAAINLSNLADLATFAGDYARAETLYREALALHTRA
jgi:tetratricopeptide (TPR) repeat protein